MQPTNYLGIYLAKGHATVVCMSVAGRDKNIVGCFNVSIEGDEEPGFGALARRIASGCAERQFIFSEVGVALDCAMFMQHSVHSEFSDTRKIDQTIRFDTEEALGSDATDVAITFRINATDENGSSLSVFTAQKQMLSEVLTALQSNNIDPVSVEPDVSCLSRFVCQRASLVSDARPFFAFLSGRNGYFITPLQRPWQAISPTPPAAMRTFLTGAAQNRDKLLARQISMTTALLEVAEPINRIEVFDSGDAVKLEDISKKLTIQTELFDIVRLGGLTEEQLSECPDAVELAIAYGAAIGYLDLADGLNFRHDYMPYQGKKLRLQKTLRFFSGAAVILVFAVGLYGFMQAVQINKYRARLRDKFAKEYSAVMSGETMPPTTAVANSKLRTALGRVKNAQKDSFAITGEEAISGRLALVLQAFNKCSKATGLNIENINITERAITISGDTDAGKRDSTLKFFEALRQTNLDVLQQRISSDEGRSTFNVTVEPKK